MTWYESSFGQDYLTLYAHRDVAEARANMRALVRLVSPPLDEPLLDLCCGAGRCLLALRELGYRQLVGLDLSADLLRAAAGALSARWPGAGGGTPPLLVRGDMRHIPFERTFATVISIFTSFGYFESDEENHAVLAAVSRGLRPRGAYVLDYLNRDYVVAHLVPEDDKQVGDWRVHNLRRLSQDSRRVEKTTTVTAADGGSRRFFESVRMYTEAEMRQMLAAAGFDQVRAYGSLAGEPFGPESQRLVLVARKAAGR